MPEPLVLKITIDKGNAIVDVKQVATALHELDAAERKAGEGANGVTDEYRTFFHQQRTGDRIMNESKQALLGISGAYVMLNQSLGGNQEKQQKVAAVLTSFIATSQASEFALFGLSRAFVSAGGSAAVFGAAIQRSLGWVSALLGAGMALATFLSLTNEKTEEVAPNFDEIAKSIQSVYEAQLKLNVIKEHEYLRGLQQEIDRTRIVFQTLQNAMGRGTLDPNVMTPEERRAYLDWQNAILKRKEYDEERDKKASETAKKLAEEKAKELNNYLDYLDKARAMEEQYALTFAKTDAELTAIRKAQLQARIADELKFGALTMEQDLKVREYRLELQRLETQDERTQAADITDLKARLREITITGMENEHEKALALIRERYESEMELAKGNADKIGLLEKMKNEELAQETRRFTREQAAARRQELQWLESGVRSTFQNMWNAIIDSSMTGAEKWKDILEGIKLTIWDIIGQIIEKMIVSGVVGFFMNLLNPMGAAAAAGGATIDSNPFGGGGGAMYGGTMPDYRDVAAVGGGQRAVSPPAADLRFASTSDLTSAVNKLSRKVDKLSSTVIISNVDGERFTRKHLTTAEVSRDRRRRIG
ncbi:MAG: hypothetical protein EPO24_07805 [Bacteroidetes bacterium]|nr:MAG: hypothetical protein EPO24_07805 [Bacteroidota bacterium]